MREQARLTLPKWPFYFGDLLLVSTAILIAFNGGGALNGWQFFWCFACVAGGAVLFTIPFILEFRGQLAIAQTRQGDVSQEMARRLHATIMEVQELKDLLTSHNDQQIATMALLDSTVKDLQERLSSITEPQGGIEALTNELRKITIATEQMELLSEEEQQEAAATEAFAYHAESTTISMQESAEEESETTPEAQSVPSSKMEVYQAFEANTDVSNDIFLEELSLGEELVLPDEVATQAAEMDSFEQAILQEGIMGQHPTEPRAQSTSETSPSYDDEPFILDELGPAGAGRDSSALVYDKYQAASAAVPQSKQPQAQKPTAPQVQPQARVEAPVEEELTRRAHTGQTKVIANVLTGIGKKPYIRGEGPGLSWDKGVPMDFVEIGKWQWVCPSAEQSVTCRIYKDDAIPAEGEDLQLQPGEQVEMSPHF